LIADHAATAGIAVAGRNGGNLVAWCHRIRGADCSDAPAGGLINRDVHFMAELDRVGSRDVEHINDVVRRAAQARLVDQIAKAGHGQQGQHHRHGKRDHQFNQGEAAFLPVWHDFPARTKVRVRMLASTADDRRSKPTGGSIFQLSGWTLGLPPSTIRASKTEGRV
jgi:hypothetical protein